VLLCFLYFFFTLLLQVATKGREGPNTCIIVPGENFFRVCHLNDTRISKDWVKSRWVHIERKADVLSRIPSVGVQTKQPDNVTPTGGLDSNSAMSDKELTAVQANSSGDKQTLVDAETEVSLIDKAFASIENDEKQTILQKRSRYSDAENDCNGEETVACTQSEVDMASAAEEDEKQTVLGKRPRDNAAEQNCNGQVFTDKGSASLDDEEQTILGKRPKVDDDAEQHCKLEVMTNKAASPVVGEKETLIGERPRDDGSEQRCNDKVFSLTDKPSACAEDVKQTALGKRPRDDDDDEQDCDGEVGVDVDVSKS
jgi:hypothetical protein